jgi:hypothetical protein
VPHSIGQLVLLTELYLGWDSDSNKFVGPLPKTMKSLVLITELYLNGATLSGPLPDFSRLTSLHNCGFKPSDMCQIPLFVPENSDCDFSVLPLCDPVSDCELLADWQPDLYDSYTCCLEDGITCENGRIVILDVSVATTGVQIEGEVLVSIGGWDKIQELYLQGNLIKGNLPVSIARLEFLRIVDISNNKMSGIITFDPPFTLIGVDSNSELTYAGKTNIEPTGSSSTDTSVSNDEASTSNIPMIVGISAGFLVFLIAFVVALAIILKRRVTGGTDEEKEENEESEDGEIEMTPHQKYSSSNKQIRLLSKINSGGFGIVWKAKYEGKTVAIKLIRLDKYEGMEYDPERNVKLFTMVVDEASIMEVMVHERIVRFIMFEIESIGIVLEYLPLGSLYEYIGNSNSRKGVMPWKERYQIMRDIYEGMEFLHSSVFDDGKKKQVLFHQDLKSGNVLLSMEAKILRGKISDFGMSCKISHL